MITGACEAVRWGVSEGSDRDSFFLKIPVISETKELRNWLSRRTEPMAEYFRGNKSWLQFKLSKNVPEHRQLWTNAVPG